LGNGDVRSTDDMMKMLTKQVVMLLWLVGQL